jgi:hypothetical protein
LSAIGIAPFCDACPENGFVSGTCEPLVSDRVRVVAEADERCR